MRRRAAAGEGRVMVRSEINIGGYDPPGESQEHSWWLIGSVSEQYLAEVIELNDTEGNNGAGIPDIIAIPASVLRYEFGEDQRQTELTWIRSQRYRTDILFIYEQMGFCDYWA